MWADAFRLLFRKRGLVVVVLSLSIAKTAVALTQPFLAQGIVSKIQAEHSLELLPFLLVAALLLTTVLGAAESYVLQRAGEDIVCQIRDQISMATLNLPFAVLDRRRRGDLVSLVGTDLTQLRNMVVDGPLRAVGDSLMLIGVVVCMAVVDWRLFGVSLIAILCSLAAIALLSRTIRSASLRYQAAIGGLTSDFLRVLGGLRTIRAAGATKRELTRIGDRSNDVRQAGYAMARVQAIVTPLSGLVIQVALLVVLAIGGIGVATNSMTISALVAFLMLLMMTFSPVGQLMTSIANLSKSVGILDRIGQLLGKNAHTILPGSPLHDGASAPDPGAKRTALDPASDPAVEFRRVSFSHLVEDGLGGEARSSTGLHDVSFSVPRGSFTGVVGPSGAGKSTILDLIEGFYEVEAGTITVLGSARLDRNADELRRHIAYVEQSAPIFHGSVRDNLRIANPQVTDAECLTALDLVRLTGALSGAASPLDVEVGEEGLMLSGGEQQRLAFARVLVSDASLVLLDEATSNLDAINEANLHGILRTRLATKTLMVVAHRIASIMDADQVIVVDEGMVTDIGDHSSLIRSSARYQALCMEQGLLRDHQRAT
ncbi:ABC transporter ATP-binding protein [Microbacterium sp. NPDC057650]|uniref:ABC transporter ATP-binding protein n=1 Tax=unclassified Microbacterium TaxID=2609290 RepID=UPI0036723E63